MKKLIVIVLIACMTFAGAALSENTGLPAYVYPGNDPIEAAVTACMVEKGKDYLLEDGAVTIPAPVMGGVSFLLYGMIAASGIRLMVDEKIDYARPRNLALTSVIFITGLSGAYIQIGSVKLTGMCLATVVGMAMGLLLYVLDRFHLTNDYEEK